MVFIICTHLRLEVRNADLYDFRCPDAPCPPEKDIGRTNLRISRVLRFFYAQKYSADKKISEGVGMDLNYRPPGSLGGICDFIS